MDLLSKPKSELSEQDLERLEEYEIAHGPLSVLQRAVDEGSQVLISLRNNHKLLAHIKAFDRHCNMVLVNVKEMWTESPVNAKGKRGRPVPRDKFVAKLFLRGDGVILVVRA